MALPRALEGGAEAPPTVFSAPHRNFERLLEPLLSRIYKNSTPYGTSAMTCGVTCHLFLFINTIKTSVLTFATL